MSTRNTTAGSGEPYWYEWTVGLLKIVEMLHSDSDIESVTLQAHGPKGWDDVIVQRSQRRREWHQVKHSRAGNNLVENSIRPTAIGKNYGKLRIMQSYAVTKSSAWIGNDGIMNKSGNGRVRSWCRWFTATLSPRSAPGSAPPSDQPALRHG